MKQTKMIYADGVVERNLFNNSAAARKYAVEQARARGTYVRYMSIVDWQVPQSWALDNR